MRRVSDWMDGTVAAVAVIVLQRTSQYVGWLWVAGWLTGLLLIIVYGAIQRQRGIASVRDEA